MSSMIKIKTVLTAIVPAGIQKSQETLVPARSSISLPREAVITEFLQQCSLSKCLDMGRLLHCLLLKSGQNYSISTGNHLANLYVKCGLLRDARHVFDQMHRRNVVSWNMMITAYARSDRQQWLVTDTEGRYNHPQVECLMIFCEMFRHGFRPNRITFASVLAASASLKHRFLVSQLHCIILKAGFASNAFVGSALVDVYAKFGAMEDATQVFEEMPELDIVMWNVILSGYSQNFQANRALGLLGRMLSAGFMPDEFTFGSVISGCGSAVALEQGKQFHCLVIKTGFQGSVFVGSALVDMYSKCGNLNDAQVVFRAIPEPNAVMRTVMIVGFSQHGFYEEALECFLEMMQQNVKPDKLTYASTLSACANLAATEEGKQVHAHLMKGGFNKVMLVGNALVSFYSKAGCVDDALQVFGSMEELDVVSWTAVIGGLAYNGVGIEAVELFEQMVGSGIEPDGVTFIGVLTACSHSGLVEEGCLYFDVMTKKYGIQRRLDHYACMIDLLGRAGRLNEAADLVRTMPFDPNPSIWSSLLSACKAYNNIEMGKFAAESLLRLEPDNAANYVTLSNMLALSGQRDESAIIRKLMRDRGLKKIPGYSWIWANKSTHAFRAGDRTHPETHKIFAMLGIIHGLIRKAGYVPDVLRYITQDIENE